MNTNGHRSTACQSDGRPALADVALTNDPAEILDHTATIADTRNSEAYDAVVSDLSTTLDLDAGLAAIVGDDAVARSHGETPIAAASTVTDELKRLSDIERFRIRARSSYHRLRATIALGSSLDHHHLSHREIDRELGRALDRALACDVPLVLAHHLDRARDIAQTSVLNGGLGRDRALDGVVDSGMDLDLACALARARDRAHEFARGRSHDQEQALVHTLNHARDLTRTRARARAQALARVRAQVLDCAVELIGEITHDPDGTPPLPDLLSVLVDIVDNFVGADLHEADPGVMGDLNGIRWSSATIWPTDWEYSIRVVSVEIEPGVQLIAGDARKHNLILTLAE